MFRLVWIGAVLLMLQLAYAQGAQELLEPEWCSHLPRSAYRDLTRVNVQDDWFEVYRIRSGVFAIYEPRQYEEVICYLITGTKQALLFDTGMGIGNLRNVVNQLTSLPVIVLNSHTHPDHVGGNHEFENILAIDTKFTRANTGGYSGPEILEWVGPSRICGSLPKDFRADSYSIHGFRISRFIKDGEQIDLGGRKLQVLLTPGHTPDSLCLFDRDNRLLFTGDLFYLGPIYLYSAEADFVAYTGSVTKLAKLRSQVDLLLPAHNVPVAAPVFLERLNGAVELIRTGRSIPQTSEGIREYEFDGFSILLPEEHN